MRSFCSSLSHVALARKALQPSPLRAAFTSMAPRLSSLSSMRTVLPSPHMTSNTTSKTVNVNHRFSDTESNSNTYNNNLNHSMAYSEHAFKESLLSKAQLDFYEKNGWLEIENFASDAQIEQLKKAANKILDDFNPEENKSVFSTEGQERTTDYYFLDSSDKIRCFFETGAFHPDGSMKTDKYTAINKLGHAMHEYDPTFKAFSNSAPMYNICKSLGFVDPKLAQSMYIFKQPLIGGKVTAHQDNAFLYTTPNSCVGIWVALEDATLENGCMWAIPGSHKKGLVNRFRRREDNTIYFDPVSKSQELVEEGGVPMQVPKGTLIVLHGDLIHFSHENKSSESRHAYTVHVVEGAKGTKWEHDNWMLNYSWFPSFTAHKQ